MRNTLRGLVPCVLVASTFVLSSLSPAGAQEPAFVRGEVNQDGVVDISDSVNILFHLFGGGGNVPCRKAADVDDNGAVELTDAVYGLAFLFQSGALPPAPFPLCGEDPTADALDCAEPPCDFGDGTLIISELMASNRDSLLDEDGDSSDWVELHLQDSAAEEVLDLGGWFITDDPTLQALWRLPDGETIERGGFLVIFASGKDRAVAGQELHADFRLDGDGDYFAIVAPDGVTVVDEIAPAFPEQLTDISYGRVQATEELVGPGDAVRYRVPRSTDSALGTSWTDPEFTTTGWSSGTLGLGFSGISTEGFEVRYVKANIAVDHLTVAEEVLANPARQTQVIDTTATVIDYFNSGGRGNYSNDNAFPGIGFVDTEDFVLEARGTVLIPDAGSWSFGVNSDDGFGFEMTDGSRTYSMSYPTPRGPADTIEVFNIVQPGPHEIRLVFYERGGGAGVELFAAQGSRTTFSPLTFRLVGDSDNGGLGLLGFAANIGTDVGDAMRGVNGSLWMRSSFQVDDPNELGGLILSMQYEDGFVAFLNGQEVASRNAPSPLVWSSRATADRSLEDAATEEEINLTSQISLLRPGTNVLAIQGLNESVGDSDFLVSPRLIAAGRTAEFRYMAEATPGRFNSSGALDFVRSVSFSVEHGFFDGAFNLALSTETDGAQIRYTRNGATPTATTGSVYSTPIRISGTSTIRAAAFKPEHLDSKVTTQSYLFPSDIIRQSPNGEAPGPGWPTGSVNGQRLDYGMDPDVVNNAQWSGLIEDALLSIPSLSLVTDLDNLFGASTGIYVNAGNDGRAWERRTSVELLEPDGSPGFTLDAGLRIRGAFSRSGSNPKHSFRLFFRGEYGAGKLRHPMFGGEGVDEFDKIDLRTSQNYSWAFDGGDQNTFLREVFSRDVQRDMRQPYTRSRYYHLYLNGVYWGLYQTEERADADFAESYLGGKSSEYDVVKNNSSGGRELQATDGTIEAYRRLYDAAVAGFSTDTAYFRVLGLRADGTPNPLGEQLVDPQNLMDYMICTYYTGDPDAPISAWAHFANNVFAIYDRESPKGFTWYRHDAEHSLGANGGLNEARLLTDPTDRSIGQEWRHFNPAWLHLRMTAHPEYALEFADRVNAAFFHGGILSPERNLARWNERAAQIELAVIGASARWGDAQRSTPRTKTDWERTVNSMRSSYFPQRTQIVLNQMRSVDMFPEAAIVSFSRHGGEVTPGFRLSLTQGNGTPGTIWYTTDGADPREWGGATSPSALEFVDSSSGTTLIARGSVWRYLDDGSNQGTAWRAPGFSDGGWDSGPAPLGYGDGDEATVVDSGPDNDKYPTTYFRRDFDLTDASSILELTLRLVRDDGAAVYLNGVEVVRDNLPAGTIGYQTYAEGPSVPVGGADESTFFAFDVDPGLLVDGRNVVAVEIHQADATSSDISFDLELVGIVAGQQSSSIRIDETTTVKARVRAGAEWGALTEARFTVGLEGLVINEVLASNKNGFEDPNEPGENPDWIEIYNGTAGTIDLGGMYLTDDPTRLTKWRIAPDILLGPGEHVLFIADDDGTQGPFHTSYQLSASGETITLVDVDGKTVIDEILFDEQSEDVSYGRFPDGGATWGFHTTPTPYASNAPHAP